MQNVLKMSKFELLPKYIKLAPGCFSWAFTYANIGCLKANVVRIYIRNYGHIYHILRLHAK